LTCKTKTERRIIFQRTLVLKKEITRLGKSNNGTTILARKIKSVRVHLLINEQLLRRTKKKFQPSKIEP